MPFGRDLAPGMLHRHTSHTEAVARISWCISERSIGVVTGEVGAGKTVSVRAALAALDPSRHTVIYLPNPADRRPRHPPRDRHRLRRPTPGSTTPPSIPQTADALAAEHAERGRTPSSSSTRPTCSTTPTRTVRMLTNHDMDSTSPFAISPLRAPPKPTRRARHNPYSIASLRHRIARMIMRKLDRCPYCDQPHRASQMADNRDFHKML